MVGWFGLVWFGLVGWLVGWLAGWLVGWLAGWLVGWCLTALSAQTGYIVLCPPQEINPTAHLL